ncbi:hypothetical protein [Candidatus Rhabdochlamydia sp. T3358]|uniref:hypothetical protein n=1 Tax=Candidatus Rhabdochlamydia sp. T3358 TaxID=2099795 RepID=UPI001484E691|nr:hypothetical protein [Candidatus Rhabdochlamydia sp. T3358]
MVKFYSMTQTERSIIASKMNTNLLKSPIVSNVSKKELKKLNELIAAASELPELIKQIV